MGLKEAEGRGDEEHKMLREANTQVSPVTCSSITILHNMSH